MYHVASLLYDQHMRELACYYPPCPSGLWIYHDIWISYILPVRLSVLVHLGVCIAYYIILLVLCKCFGSVRSRYQCTSKLYCINKVP